jgi:hypothetical protein
LHYPRIMDHNDQMDNLIAGKGTVIPIVQEIRFKIF